MSTPGKVTTLKVSPDKLRAILDSKDKSTPAKESSPSPDVKPDVSATATAAAAAVAGLTNGDTASDSNPATPGQAGTPAMAPPTKKGVKRPAPGANSEPRDRKKPGPKKKRLDDGETKTDRGHKLGPKANQGAINAGLRALDRSGKPCRKWTKGSFTLKSFTGVTWEIARWTAPTKAAGDDAGAPEETAAAEEKTDGKTDNNNKNNNSNSNDKAADAQGGADARKEGKTEGADGDVEMKDAPSSLATDSPLRPAIAAA